jgi:SAM-dependent methyltransferase
MSDHSISKELSTHVDRVCDKYFRRNKLSQNEIDRLSFDKLRFGRSLQWLIELSMDGKKALELGGESLASEVLKGYFPTAKWQLSYTDLRDAFPYDSNSFEIVLCMEVIEHISDQPYLHATTLTGVKHVLSECFRILSPGSHLFLTTPNAASFWTITRAMLHQPPMLYEYHFREFTIEEIRALVEASGFKILKSGTEQVWHFWNFKPLTEFMKKNGYNIEDRWDDIFILAIRPERDNETALRNYSQYDKQYRVPVPC